MMSGGMAISRRAVRDARDRVAKVSFASNAKKARKAVWIVRKCAKRFCFKSSKNFIKSLFAFHSSSSRVSVSIGDSSPLFVQWIDRAAHLAIGELAPVGGGDAHPIAQHRALGDRQENRP